MNFLTTTFQIQGWVFVPAIFLLSFVGFKWSTGTFRDTTLKIAYFAMCFVFLYYIFK